MGTSKKRVSKGTAGAVRPAGAGRKKPAVRRFSVARKLELLRQYEACGTTMREFCDQHEVGNASLCRWRQQYSQHGVAGLQPKSNPRSKGHRHQRSFTPEERREAVETFLRSGLMQKDFCARWGICKNTLIKWLDRYQQHGPKGLENQPYRRKKPHPKALPAPTKEKIRAVKTEHQRFGLRKLRDWLFRYHDTKVSVPTIRKTLKESDQHKPLPPKKKRKKAMPPRRFERAKPRELWQSDITSFVMPRSGRRVYLTVFLDDYSRYIVSWNLATHQRQELVTEALLEGMERFGKPKEVLTDQGRQYFAWRGKSGFQKLLAKEGICHVVSRAHHPQTLGKTERFWKTVNEEFWTRVRPDELGAARQRLAHFIHHFNHFRPHQGINGAVPADRFFGAEDAMRNTLEAGMEHELKQALGDPPRETMYLFGRIGAESVSLHGEGGQLIVETQTGNRRLEMKEFGAPEVEQEAEDAEGKEAGAIQDAGASGGSGERSLGGSERGGEKQGAPGLRIDPQLLAGPEKQSGSSGGIGSETTTGMAAFANGDLGYGVWSTSAATTPGSRADFGGCGEPEEAHPKPGEGGGNHDTHGGDPSRSTDESGADAEQIGEGKKEGDTQENCGSWWEGDWQTGGFLRED
jgi:transposase InsO family protein